VPFRASERFAAYAAHELRGPVATQRTLAEVALANPDSDAALLREVARRVIANCDHQQRLIEALLDLTRSRCGVSRREAVDLAVVTTRARRDHDVGGLRWVVMLEPASTIGDPDLLAQLTANLVSNAIRHNIAGGRIELSTRTDSSGAVLSVANTGRPIQPGELQRLFQPFQRLAATPTGTAEGVGLGLAIVQAIAEAHNALIDARTRAGGGLEIQVSFPSILPSKAVPELARGPAVQRLAPARS
jgi:signal transduction histidine kinase